MSVEAITLALTAPVARSSAKFVLVAMANCANADMTCWPSTQYLSEATAQDRKTVLENVKRLKEEGFIVDTGERRGQTKQVIVYRLNMPENGTVKQARKRNSSEKGTVPKTDAKSTEIPHEESRFSAETVPKTGHGTVNEPSIEPSGNRQKKAKDPATVEVSELLQAGFDEQTALDFIAHKAKLKAPLTARAWKDHLREAGKAGWTPMDAAEKVMAKSWKGFEASYVKDETKGRGGGVGKQTALEAHNRAVLDDLFRRGSM